MKALWNFAKISNSRAIFKTYLKLSALAFFHNYKKFVFQTSIRTFVFYFIRQLELSNMYKKFFCVKNQTFQAGDKNFFLWKIWVSIKCFFFRWKIKFHCAGVRNFSFWKLVFWASMKFFFFGWKKLFGQKFLCLIAPDCCIILYLSKYYFCI